MAAELLHFEPTITWADFNWFSMVQVAQINRAATMVIRDRMHFGR